MICFTVVKHFITYHLNYFFKHESKNLYEIKLRTPLRTFEAENTQKIRTSRLGEKNGVLIRKKKCILSLLPPPLPPLSPPSCLVAPHILKLPHFWLRVVFTFQCPHLYYAEVFIHGSPNSFCQSVCQCLN